MIEEQQQRLAGLVRQIESGFDTVSTSKKALERHAVYYGIRENNPYDTGHVGEERIYRHKSYANGQLKAEGEHPAGPPCSTPVAAVDAFEKHFLPLTAQHSGELLWRMRPFLEPWPDGIDGSKRWVVFCRCSFGDSPDEVIRPAQEENPNVETDEREEVSAGPPASHRGE